jgi:hypothetical protein
VLTSRRNYFKENVYELRDMVNTLAYPSNYGSRTDSFFLDMTPLLAGGATGEPDWMGIAALQSAYRDGSRCVHLPQFQ